MEVLFADHLENRVLREAGFIVVSDLGYDKPGAFRWVLDVDADGDMEMGEEGDMDMTEGEGDMDMADDDHMEHGFMVMRQPGEQASVTFTVPADASGEWEIACFEEDGAHYDDGMRGTLIIEVDA